jgi:hypothetical protein
MRILLLVVRTAPESVSLPISELNSYPGLLLEQMTASLQRVVRDPFQAFKETEAFGPQLVVFQGNSKHTLAWQKLYQICFPRLFSFVSEQSDLFAILAELNPRLWALRRGRLETKTKAYRPQADVDLTLLFSDFEPRAKAQALTRFETWIQSHPKFVPYFKLVDSNDFERILYCQALLEAALTDWQCPAAVKALDVGTHAWTYAPALAVTLRERASLVELTGLELDPWYLYEGSTRGDLARYYAQISQARFLEGDFFQFRESQDLICHFLPLILRQNALLWKIPLQYHHPVQWLKHTWDRLRPNGLAVFYTSKEVEYTAFLEAVKNAGLQLAQTGPWFCPWRQQEHGFLSLLKR